MPTEQDWRQSDAARRLREQADNERIRRQGEARHHALQAQTVLDHPGWQWFARQIDEYKGRIDQYILQAQERVTHKNLTAQEEAWLKLDCRKAIGEDRKSTRLNSSHIQKSRMPSSA